MAMMSQSTQCVNLFPFAMMQIITAGHCMANFEKHYYEIRAGMLRRRSFAPMSQTVKVQQVFVHEQYERRGKKTIKQFQVRILLFPKSIYTLSLVFRHEK